MNVHLTAKCLNIQVFVFHLFFYSELHSTGYRGGEEEAPQAYIKYVEEADGKANKGSRMKARLAIVLFALSLNISTKVSQ
jgi:hypothetical protein